MENQEGSKNNEFLSKIIERYDFIESIIITDFDGSLMISSFKIVIQQKKKTKKIYVQFYLIISIFP